MDGDQLKKKENLNLGTQWPFGFPEKRKTPFDVGGKSKVEQASIVINRATQ